MSRFAAIKTQLLGSKNHRFQNETKRKTFTVNINFICIRRKNVYNIMFIIIIVIIISFIYTRKDLSIMLVGSCKFNYSIGVL